MLDVRYYLYPIRKHGHFIFPIAFLTVDADISLSFMLTPTLSSALYLLLLRFLHRDYMQVIGLGTITSMQWLHTVS